MPALVSTKRASFLGLSSFLEAMGELYRKPKGWPLFRGTSLPDISKLLTLAD